MQMSILDAASIRFSVADVRLMTLPIYMVAVGLSRVTLVYIKDKGSNLESCNNTITFWLDVFLASNKFSP